MLNLRTTPAFWDSAQIKQNKTPNSWTTFWTSCDLTTIPVYPLFMARALTHSRCVFVCELCDKQTLAPCLFWEEKQQHTWSELTCSWTSGTSSQRFWLRCSPAESYLPQTTAFYRPTLLTPSLTTTSSKQQPSGDNSITPALRTKESENKYDKSRLFTPACPRPSLSSSLCVCVLWDRH